MGLRGRGLPAVLALLPLTTSFVMLLPRSPSAQATTGTTQNNGCLGVTNTFSQFAVPIAGTGAPNPDTASSAITLSGTSVAISVDSTLIGAGVVTGLVSAADNLADIGVTKNDGTASSTAGVDAVTAATGSVKLKIAGSNTTQATQTASNTAPANTTFYVTADALGGTVKVYTAISSPPAASPVPTRTGTLLTGSLTVSIPLSDTTWTPTGSGNVVFTEQNLVPASLSTPSSADQLAAPLILLPKINGSISTPFHCWPGTVSSATPAALVPGSSNAIDTVTVGSGTTTTTAVGATTTTVAGATTTTVAGATTTTMAGETTTTVAGTTPTTGSGGGPGGGGTATATGNNTGTNTYTTTCTNSVTPDKSHLTFTITGTAPKQVTVSSQASVTDETWKVAVPGDLLTTAINLGLLKAGDIVNGTVTAGVFASNTKEGTQNSPPVPVTIGPIQVDSTTGSAKDASATLAVPGGSWTATGGTIGWQMAKTTFLITIGALKVTFTCDPGTGLTPFVTTSVIGKSTSVLGATLAFTGPKAVIELTILALILFDLGYLAWSAGVPARRRRMTR